MISIKQLVLYSVLALPLAFAGMPLYVHAPDYFTTHHNISLASIGFALLFLRFLDALQDPIIGRLSDKHAQHRKIIITIASIILVVSFGFLFQPLIQNKLVWFCVFILLATTSFSVISINLNSLGGLWARNKIQSNKITSFREAFGLIGLLLAILLPSILQTSSTPNQAFLYVSIVLAVLAVIGLVCHYKWCFSGGAYSTYNFKFSLKNIPKQTRNLFLAYGFSMLASSIPALLVLFYIRDLLGAESYTGLFLLLYFISGAVGMPLWQYLSNKYGKYTSWLIAMSLATFVFIWAYFLSASDIWQYAIICILSGIAFGADLSLPPAILADDIIKYKLQNQASSLFSILTFLSKLSLALASAIVLPLLDYQGFVPAMANSQQALHALSLAYAIVPCFIKLVSIILLKRCIKYQP